MRVAKANLTKYRAIESAEISFDRNITVLIGRNGAGKTTILDALAKALSVINSTSRDISEQYHVQVLTLKNNGEDEVSAPKIDVEFIAESEDEVSVDSVRVKLGSKSMNYSTQQELIRFVSTHLDDAKRKMLFVYYKQDRNFETRGQSDSFDKNGDSVDFLSGDLRAIRDLEDWWDKRDAQEARTLRDTGDLSFRDPQLQAIRKLIKHVDPFTDVRFMTTSNLSGLYFVKYGSDFVHVSQLSSGERSYIILLADLARRLQVTSPNEELEKIPGIVLIDEIELNLHPEWQSEIIPTLLRIFSTCQFVITTHSPQVISAVRSDSVRKVVRDAAGLINISTPTYTRGRSSDYLLEGVFGSPERLPKVDRLINEFNNAIDGRDPVAARKLLDQIESEIDGFPPELLFLRNRLRSLDKPR